MSIPEIPEIGQALKKSETHSFALPNISRTKMRIPQYKTSRVSQHKSVFLDKVKDITPDTRYEDMETANITQQQKKLKNLLREFNQETYGILGKYIDQPRKLSSVKKPRSSSVISQIKDKQIINSQEALEICKKQLASLQKKSESLKFVSTQDFEKKISEIKDQIEQIRMVNKQINKGNTLRALGLKKDDEKVYHEVSDLEYQKYILDLKKERLTSDTEYVKQQEKSLAQKLQDCDKKIQQMTQEYNKIMNEENQRNQHSQNKVKFSTKKKALERNKKQRQANSLSSVATNNRYQGHYLKLLKNLDQLKKSSEKIDLQRQQLDLKIENSKKTLVLNEQKYSLIKNSKQLSKIQEGKQQEKQKRGSK